MRPIDADVLLNNTDGLEHVKWSEEYGHVVLVCDIVYAPTLDVKEVKQGKWIEETGMLMCSECGDAWGTQQFDEVMSFNYCPNCGADMRKETEDE